MINSNVLESSNENSLMVQNVIDTRSEHSVAQPLHSNSLLGLISFYAKRNFYIYSPKSPTRYHRCSPIRTALTTRTPLPLVSQKGKLYYYIAILRSCLYSPSIFKDVPYRYSVRSPFAVSRPTVQL